MAISGSTGGGGSKSGDVRAGGAFVEVSMKDSLTKALAGINARVKKFAAGMREVGGSIALLGGAALAPLLAISKSGIDRAEGIARMSKELNVTIDQMQRLQYAADVTGSSIDDIMRNPQRFSQLMKDAPILDVEEIKSAVAINQEFRKSWIGIQNALIPLASAIAPIVQTVGEFVRQNSGLVQIAAAASAGVAALGISLWATGTAITATTATVGGLVAAVSLLASPIGLVTAAIVGAGAGLVMFTQAGQNAFKDFKATFTSMLDTARESLGGIVAALSKGRIDLALKVATSATILVWKEFCAAMAKKWGETKSDIVGSFRDMKYILGNLGVDAASWLAKSGLARLPVTNRQINIGADAAKNDLAKQLDRDRDAAKAEQDKKLAEARAEVDKARAALAASLKEVAEAPKKPKGAAMNPNDYMYFAGIASRGAFRVTGDQRQFSEGTNAAKEQMKLAGRQVGLLERIDTGIAGLNKNLRLT